MRAAVHAGARTAPTSWSHPGLRGECSPCDDSLSLVWVVVATCFALALVTLVLYFVSGVDASKEFFLGLNARTLRVGITFGKIAISLVQITTQLGIAFQVQWPPWFHGLLKFLKLFSFDFLSFIGAAEPAARFSCAPALLTSHGCGWRGRYRLPRELLILWRSCWAAPSLRGRRRPCPRGCRRHTGCAPCTRSLLTLTTKDKTADAANGSVAAGAQ